MIAPALYSSESVDWNTPENVLRKVREVGRIALDPCGNATSIVESAFAWTLADDGLAKPWTGYGLVYVNPPYSRTDLPKWSTKIAEEAFLGAEIIALVPARTDSRWFQQMAHKANAICFWRGRLRFLGGKHSAPFPSALLYFGRHYERFREVFGACGLVLV